MLDPADLLMSATLRALREERVDPQQDRFERTVWSVELAAGEFAVLTSDATTRQQVERIAAEANRLSAILAAQAKAARWKADTL